MASGKCTMLLPRSSYLEVYHRDDEDSWKPVGNLPDAIRSLALSGGKGEVK